MKEFQELVEVIHRILRKSKFAEKPGARATVIINPVSGGLRRSIVGIHERVEPLTAVLAGKPDRDIAVIPCFTGYSGHAVVLARELAEEQLKELSETGVPSIPHLVLVAGGDGTAQEVCTGLAQASEDAGRPLSGLSIFRLPFGTGNDNVDAPDLETAVTMLLSATGERPLPLLQVTPKNWKSIYSANIASIGLDAYVTHMTNLMKRLLPGNFYALMVDVAVLFYEMAYPPSELVIHDADSGAEIFAGRFLLAAAGVTGHRMYGSGKKILPGDENLCVAGPMNLAAKMRVKPLFFEGKHVSEPGVYMHTVKRIVCDYKTPILLQLDGETWKLGAADFPLEMEVKKPVFSVLTN